MKIPVQIVNEDDDSVVAYVNLADEQSFSQLADLMDGLGYRVEEIAE